MKAIRHINFLLVAALLIAAVGIFPSQASAAPVVALSNLGSGAFGMSLPGYEAVGFTTPAGPTYALTSVSLGLWSYSCNLLAWLYTNNAGVPGSQLAAFTPVSSGNVVTLPTPILLSASTSYWIVVSTSCGTSPTWGYSGTAPTGLFGYIGSAHYNTGTMGPWTLFSNYDFELYAELTSPEVGLSDTILNFGNQELGTTSAPQTITVTNTGIVDVNITFFSTIGTNFSLSNNTCAYATVAPGNTCTFDVTFSPLYTGDLLGIVYMNSNATSSPDTFNFLGYGFIPLGATFTSVGAYDGYVTESNENSSSGGTANTSATTIMVGDQLLDRQVMGFLHFDTASLPDNAVVTSATLRVKRQAVTGTNPFLTHGNLNVDFGTPFFGAEAALKAADFQAYPSMNFQGPFNSTPLAGNWYEAVFSDFTYINLTGTTQFRLHFDLGDNDDNSADLIKFFSANYLNASYRPVLIVEYYVP